MLNIPIDSHKVLDLINFYVSKIEDLTSDRTLMLMTVNVRQ